MEQIELVSFNICPFVQRSTITLEQKKVPYKITFIDLADKPDWFLKISPFGKVPVLRQGDTVVFESAVINEYLDETHGPSMHPQDSLQRAHNRAWIEFGSSLIGSQFGLYSTGDQWDQKWQETMEKLTRVEEQIQGPYFNGNDMSLVDAAYAPALMRFDIVARHTNLSFYDATPKVAAWSRTLLGLESVQKSVVSDFEDLFLAYFRKKDGHLARLLSPA